MQCTSKIFLRKEGIYVPCTKCINCRINRSEVWRFRLEQEVEVCKSAHFLTLTYSDEYIVRNDLGHSVLIKSDLQKFFKRLRRSIEYEQTKYVSQNLRGAETITFPAVRYYAVGEYGGQTYRAHYHAIVFNIPKSTISELARIWKFGHVKVGTVTSASIRYVTKYITKVDTRDLEDMELTNPFAIMSKGIGASYVDDDRREYHSRPESLYTINRGDKRQPIGKYLEGKIHVTDEAKQRVAQAKFEYAEQQRLKHIERLKNLETSYTKEKKMQKQRELIYKLNNKRNKL